MTPSRQSPHLSLLFARRNSARPAPVLAQHRTPYADWPLASTQNRTPYAVQISACHRTPYAVQISACHRTPYAVQISACHRTPYANSTPASSRHRTPYANSTPASSRHRTPYANSTPASSRHRTPYGLLTSAASQHRTPYTLSSTNPASSRHRAPYAVLDDAWIQNIANTPVLRHGTRVLPISTASLSADEQSPYWVAAITIESATDYSAMDIGDSVTMELSTASYTLVIDGKTTSRTTPGEVVYQISAISPLALLDAPYAGVQDYATTSPTLASAAVASIIGPNTWALPDWPIPAQALQITSATPLAAARAIVQAIGGLIESAPDGSIVCRARHPISPPDYTQAACAHALTDDAVLESSARMAPLRGYNRVQVSNSADSTAASATDALEYVPDPGSDTAGTVRARPSPARPVLLVHSGHPDTAITAQGSVTRTEAELCEFIAGQASLSYPADSVAASTWQHVDLGAVAIDADASTLTASTPGYSLAQISYTTTALQWRVALPAPSEVVQFILIDA